MSNLDSEYQNFDGSWGDDLPGVDRPITVESALLQMRELSTKRDFECAHKIADDILLRLINDPEITAAFDSVGRWYE